jgi:hypothetical protein
MKKEKVTKFDFDAALKAMDALPIPEVHGVLPSRTDFVEETKRVDRTSLLLEDYYDLGNQDALVQAKDEREAEIAKAKLARIEKIVDLDADSPEDLAPSYVGKIILQCPRCMEKFYKDAKDVVYDDENPELANVGEVCQHCGEDGGYNVIGKVGPVEDSEMANYVTADRLSATEQSDSSSQANFVDTPEDATSQSQDLDLPPVSTNETELPADNSTDSSEETSNEQTTSNQSGEQSEDNEEPKEEAEEKKKKEIKEESLNTLQENITSSSEADLNKMLAAHNNYIKYLQDSIKAEEAKLAKTENEFVKDAINKNIESYKVALENALPEEVLNATSNASDDLPTPEEAIDAAKGSNELNLDLPQEQDKQEEAPKTNVSKKEALQEDVGNLNGLVNSILAGLDSADGDIKEDLNDRTKPTLEDYLNKAWNIFKQYKAKNRNDYPVLMVKNAGDPNTTYIFIEQWAKSKNIVLNKDCTILTLGKPTPDLLAKLEELKQTQFVVGIITVNDVYYDLGSFTYIVDLAEYDANGENIDEDLNGLSEAVSTTELDNLFNSSTFKSAASEEEKAKGRKLAALYAQNKTTLPENLQALHNRSFDRHITKYLTEVYQNVDKFTSTDCTIAKDKKTLVIEGLIHFKSGKVQSTAFTFIPTKITDKGYLFEGYNVDFNNGDKAYMLEAYIPTDHSFLVANRFSYKYNIGSCLVEGLN